MALTNKWVTYLDRSFKSIKASVLNRVKVILPEMTDHSESNLFVILVSIFAGLIEQVNYYVDNVARESYVTTARRYSSLIKITRLIDYRVRAKVAATTDIYIRAIDSNGDLVNLVNNYTFDAGLVVKDASGMEFITTRKITMLASTSVVTVGIKQSKLIINFNIGTSTNSPNQTYKLSDFYEHDTLQITIDGETWELKQTLAYSGPLTKHFLVEVNESKEAWVVFGDDINGAIPPAAQTILGTYYETKGSTGNVDPDTINIWGSAPIPPAQVPAIASFEITNPIKASGGINEEDTEGIRRHAPLSLRTLDRAVTRQDYKDIAELVPGVNKAAVLVDQVSKSIIVYITPDEGGTASSGLLLSVEEEFLLKGVMGPIVTAYPAGETPLRIELTVTAKFRRDTAETESDIKTALLNSFGFNNSDVNKKIRTSDIISLIDNLDKVDYLTLDLLTTKPYPRVVHGSNYLENAWYVTVNPENTSIIRWRLVVINSTEAVLYRKVGSSVEDRDGVVAINSSDPGAPQYTSVGLEVSIGIWGSYTIGDTWVFYTYPYNKDIEFLDYTIPIIDLNEISITVNKQLIPNS